MTPKEAIDFINNEVQIDVRFCTEEKVDKTRAVFEFAIKAIKKQIPKYVKYPKGFRGIRDTRFYCPVCNSLTRQREKWCHKCGQAVKYPKAIYREKENRIVLDWSDTE